MAEIDRLHERGKLQDYFEARADDYRDRYRETPSTLDP